MIDVFLFLAVVAVSCLFVYVLRAAAYWFTRDRVDVRSDIEPTRPSPRPYIESVGRALRAGTVSTREAAEGMRLAFRERPLPDWLEVTERQRKRIEAAFDSNVEIGFYGKQFEELRRKVMASEITDFDAATKLSALHADHEIEKPSGWHPLPMAVLQGILREKGE